MLLKKIKLQHFRNYESQEADFDEKLNVISGRNAQGKTNLLEAIHFLSTGRSFRTTRVYELIQKGSKSLDVSGIVEKDGGIQRISIHYSENRKSAHINERTVGRFHEIVGVLNTVAFTPDDMEIIKGFPSERRRYLDMQIAMLNRGYLKNLYRYNEIVRQRNASLKARDKEMINIWNEELVKYGAYIVKERKGALERLSKHACGQYMKITERAETFEVLYRTEIAGEDIKEIEDSFHERLHAKTEVEFKNGITMTGPHRDDLSFIIKGLDARSYGSEGQRRSAVIALRLAQYELAKEISKDTPVILIDDITAELDPVRKRAFLPLLEEKGQVFAATASGDENFAEWRNAKVFKVENGRMF